VNSGIIAAEKKSIKKYLQWQFFSRYIMLFNFETTIDFDTTCTYMDQNPQKENSLFISYKMAVVVVIIL
jgi:hypothetical protein